MKKIIIIAVYILISLNVFALEIVLYCDNAYPPYSWEEIISYEQGYLGISNTSDFKYPYKQDFIKKFVEIVNIFKQDGTIQCIVSKYF